MTVVELAPALVVAGAVAFDLVLGEPPGPVHPVVWMGNLIGALRRRAPKAGAARQLAWGLAVALGVPALFATGAVVLVRITDDHPALALAAGIVLLKPMFAIRALGGAGRTVAAALAAGDLDQARYHLRALCSRDARQLSGPEVAAGAVESLAENTSDSVVAPLFYFALFGLPGAVAYRAINTMDAMLGYRGDLEYLGKAAARLDDLANLIPARLTAALLLVAGALVGGRGGADPHGGLRILLRDGSKTASPNAGRPMAAMAGLLGVALSKPGHYRLGDDDHPLSHRTIARAWRLCLIAAALAAALCAILAVVVHP
jgi:adenosylcobinamide-phosphate synthase